MHSSMDSQFQLDALFCKFFSLDYYTVMSSLWTWLAVLTTALSFWRIRTKTVSHSDDNESVAATYESRDMGTPSICENENGVEATTKSKFTVAYFGDQNHVDDEVEEIDSFTYVSEQVCNYSNEPDRLMYVRRNIRDMSWYTCQDLTALDGRVVKLWEDNQRKKNRLAN